MPNDTKPLWEQRIENPSAYPVILNPDGSVTTHRLATATTDNGAVVFPTVVLRDGQLVELPMDQALQHARETKGFKFFSDPTAAEEYAHGSWKTPEFHAQTQAVAKALRDKAK